MKHRKKPNQESFHPALSFPPQIRRKNAGVWILLPKPCQEHRWAPAQSKRTKFNDVVVGKPRLLKQGDEKGNRVIKNLLQLLLIIPSISHKEQSFGLRIQFLSAILKDIIIYPGN